MQPEESRDVPYRGNLTWIFFLLIVFGMALFVNFMTLMSYADIGDPDEESREDESSEEG